MSKLRPLRITTKARNDVSDRPVLRYGSYGGLCSALQAGEMFGAANIIGRL